MSYFFHSITDHYADFSGRARRKEYWLFVLFDFLFGLLALLVDRLLDTAGLVTFCYGLITFLPAFSVKVRRLHDVDKGFGFLLLCGCLTVVTVCLWLFLFGSAMAALLHIPQLDEVFGGNHSDLLFAAVVSSGLWGVFQLWLFISLVQEGNRWSNQYGPSPKELDLLSTQIHSPVFHQGPTRDVPSWACLKCGSLNIVDNTFCGRCAAPKPNGDGLSSTSNQRQQPPVPSAPSQWQQSPAQPLVSVPPPQNRCCGKCGSAVPVESVFCGSCGSRQQAHTNVPPQFEQAQQPGRPSQTRFCGSCRSKFAGT